MTADSLLLRALTGLRPPKASFSRWSVVAGLLGALGAAHHLGGENIGLYTFFVLPCAFAAWSISLLAGMLAAVASAAIVLASDLATRADAPRIDLAVNAALRVGLYALVSWGADTIGGLLERLQDASRTDSLTGLANRREFLMRGAEEVRRAKRTGRPFSLLYLDLDDFKSVNDRHGHAAGDALLKRAGDVLKGQLRSIDIPARLGGDEFAVLLPETGGEGAMRAAQSVQQELRGESIGTRHPVSWSIGVATFVQVPASFEAALTCADELMYAAKRDSKGTLAQKNFS